MPYLVSLLTVATAVVVLLVLLVRLRRPARRLTGTARACRAYLADRIGLLSARVAGLKVALRRRRRSRNVESSGGSATA